jgi:hypothetical protein
MKIEKQALDILQSMSWSESRRIDPAPFVAALEEEGYYVFPLAVSFIENFGGLSGKKPGYRIQESWKEVHFDPCRAIQNIYRERVVEYESRTGESLVTIGESDNMHMTLLISETGRMLAGYDDELFLLGNNPIEGLNALLGNKEVPTIP